MQIRKGMRIIIILVFNVLLLCSCTSQKSNEVSENINTTEETTMEEITESETTNYEETYNFISYKDYSEDLAWVLFECVDDLSEYWGCINKSGKMVFSVEAASIQEVTPFSNGYAYIMYDDSVKVIDKTGKITSEYTVDDSNKVLCYGEGYVVSQKYKADFDSVKYIINMCNPDGSIIQSLELDDMEDYYHFEYFGKGVFGYYLSPWDWKIYLSSIDKWIDYNPGGNNTFYFYGNTALTEIEYGGGFDSSDGFRGKMNLLSLNGKRNKVIIPEDCGWDWVEGPIIDNTCILHEYKEFLVSFNLKTGQFNKIADSYADKIIYDELPNPLAFSNGRIALPLKGDDGYRYMAVFDEEWNLVIDPIQIDKNKLHEYCNERLIVSDDDDCIIYDTEGNIMYKLSDTEYSEILDYSNGVARVEGETIPTYVDKEGKLLFEKVDMSEVIK